MPENYAYTDTVAVDTAIVDEGKVAEVERYALTSGTVERYAHRFRMPYSLTEHEVETVPVESRLTVPVVVRRASPARKSGDPIAASTPWWTSDTSTISVLVELTVTVPSREEMIADLIPLLDQWKTAPSPRNQWLRRSAMEQLKAVYRTENGPQWVSEYVTELIVARARYSEAADLARLSLDADPSQAEMWDVFAHASYAMGRLEEAGDAWDAADARGYAFNSTRCVDRDEPWRSSTGTGR